jgi:hypothetical protein
VHERLCNGGRGIGNQLESLFVNPLARAMCSVAACRTQVVKRDGLGYDDNRIMTVTVE